MEGITQYGPLNRALGGRRANARGSSFVSSPSSGFDVAMVDIGTAMDELGVEGRPCGASYHRTGMSSDAQFSARLRAGDGDELRLIYERALPFVAPSVILSTAFLQGDCYHQTLGVAENVDVQSSFKCPFFNSSMRSTTVR